ncbi:MAG: hypothetical protein PHW04_14140 [Candidatus Wallbacteria bacterium]|nr:hypothetical protein [Candidatus Wallbacteria bacterium]
MKTCRKVSDLTVDEFKILVHDIIAEDLSAWKESFEIMANAALMEKVEKADQDWKTQKKGSYKSWESIR